MNESFVKKGDSKVISLLVLIERVKTQRFLLVLIARLKGGHQVW